MGLKYFRNAAETAKVLGAKVFCRSLYAELFRGRWLPDDERKAEWDRSVKAMKEAADICADGGLTIALEPLNRFETDFINTAHQAKRYVEEVASPTSRFTSTRSTCAWKRSTLARPFAKRASIWRTFTPTPMTAAPLAKVTFRGRRWLRH